MSETGTGPIEIPRDVVVKSVLSFDGIHEAFTNAGLDPNTVTTDQLRSIIETTAYDEKYLFHSYNRRFMGLSEISSVSKPISMHSVIAPKDWSGREIVTLTFNASTITNLLTAGAFAYDPEGFYVLGGEESRAVRYVASNLTQLAAYRNDLAGEVFAELLNTLDATTVFQNPFSLI